MKLFIYYGRISKATCRELTQKKRGEEVVVEASVPKDSEDECSAFIGHFLIPHGASTTVLRTVEIISFKPWNNVFQEILLSPMLETVKLRFREIYLDILRPGFKGKLSWPVLTIWQPCLSISLPVEELGYVFIF